MKKLDCTISYDLREIEKSPVYHFYNTASKLWKENNRISPEKTEAAAIALGYRVARFHNQNGGDLYLRYADDRSFLKANGKIGKNILQKGWCSTDSYQQVLNQQSAFWSEVQKFLMIVAPESQDPFIKEDRYVWQSGYCKASRSRYAALIVSQGIYTLAITSGLNFRDSGIGRSRVYDLYQWDTGTPFKEVWSDTLKIVEEIEEIENPSTPIAIPQ